MATAIRLDFVGREASTKTKSISGPLNTRIRSFVKGLVERDWPKERPDSVAQANVTQAAKAIGVAQATLTDVLNEKRGVGLESLILIADYAKVTIDHIIKGLPPPVPGQANRRAPVPIERDPYPERVIVRERSWYAEEPAPVRHLFESLEFDGGAWLDSHGWHSWLKRASAAYGKWVKAGGDPNDFDFDFEPEKESEFDEKRVEKSPKKFGRKG